ncbi:MAG: hypothetical protein ACXVB4_06085 [Pseudobdellovibrionaceae bacterium]
MELMKAALLDSIVCVGNRRGYVRSDGTVIKPTNVKSYCRVLTKAYEYSRERFKNGIPPNWPHSKEKAGSWTVEEKERIIEALEELPDILLSDKIAGIYRLKKSKDFPNPASSSYGVIVIYDSSFDSSRNLGRILCHELSHQNFKDLSNEEKQDYRRATGWHLKLESDRNVYWVGRKSGYVEEDGKNSYEEDYSNNLEYYLYDPDKLKKVTPSGYEWIKKHFGDGFRIKGQKR